MTDEILYEVDADGIATITMNRPERLNAMNRPFMDQLRDIVNVAAYDLDVRCVILTGAGRAFCAGGDMKERRAPVDRLALDVRIANGRRTIDTSRILHDMSKPTIAMINGPVAGAGIGLAAACDLRFAATTATFTPAFVERGYSGDYGSTYLWTKIIGSGKTREMFMMGGQFDAHEAYDRGLYTRLFPDAELKQKTWEHARKMVANHASCWRLMKSSLNVAEDSTIETAFDMEVNNMAMSMQMVRDTYVVEKKG